MASTANLLASKTCRITSVDLEIEDILEALAEKYPDRKFLRKKLDEGIPGISSSDEVVLSGDEEYESLIQQLKKKEEELEQSDLTCSKALTSIQTFHKHQKDLFDEFVVLRQKYDEQKNTLMSVLWTHCSQHHPELKHIPPMEDPEHYVETEDELGPNYSVGPILGEGQFASVYTCTKNGEEDIELALKSVKKERIMSFHGIKRMSNEIKTLRVLKSHYIVCIHDVIQTAHKLYIITEKGGPDLFEFFDEHPEGVPEEWAKQIVHGIMKAVQFCHDKSYCHRDLKPENILMNFDPNTSICSDLKLCDFGLSMPVKERMVLSDFCGSPGFFAPEMITKGAYYGDKADIWSTGCILLELILGHEKFCDVWMCAYDYDILQDKERFSESISQAVETLSPHLESFSPELSEFVSLFLKLRSSERPPIKKLLQHKWLEDFREELKSRTASFHEDLTVQIDGFDQLSVSPVPSGSPDPLTRIRLDSLDSPQRQPMILASSPFLPENISGTDEWKEKQRALVKDSYSDRERERLEKHNKQDKDGDHVYHLPPIEPPTPSLSKAKKILVKGDNLAKMAEKSEPLLEESEEIEGTSTNHHVEEESKIESKSSYKNDDLSVLKRAPTDSTDNLSETSSHIDASFDSADITVLRSQSERRLSETSPHTDGGM
jgi:serine/threonine protein kinase